jgi:hypothetical protein
MGFTGLRRGDTLRETPCGVAAPVTGNIPRAGCVATRVGTVDVNRQPIGISVLGGPTTVVDLGGWRFVIDPTFDEISRPCSSPRVHFSVGTDNRIYPAATCFLPNTRSINAVSPYVGARTAFVG